MADVRGARHGPARPPGGHPRRGPQLQALHPGPRLPRHHHAQPPGPVRRPGHRRRAARPARAARRARASTPSRSCRPSAPRCRPPQRRKRHLAEGLPHAPGVYLFRDDSARVLYVGTSRDLRTRVRSYFTASETRTRMGEMVGLADSVTGIECATPLEAEVRELRLIAEHKPRYNRRSPVPGEGPLAQADRRALPAAVAGAARSPTTAPTTSARSRARRRAEKCLAALHEAFPLRQCTQRLARSPPGRPCVLAEMGRCLAPVRRQRRRRRRTPRWCAGCATTCSSDADDVVELITQRMAGWPTDERYEEAGVPPRPAGRLRPRGRPHAAADRPRLDPRAGRRPPRGRPDRPGAGRSTSSATAGWPQPGSSRPAPTPSQFVAELVAERRDRRPAARARPRRPPPRRPSASCAGSRQPGVRLVDVDGEWTCPVGGATRHLCRSTTPWSPVAARPGARSTTAATWPPSPSRPRVR